jgi:outer membrane protein OmpA-like peptidoglycan-associated protein
MIAALAAGAAASTLGACAQVQKFRTRADMVAAPVCTDFSFPIYFASGSEQLPPAALQVIDQHAAQVRACQVASVNVTGLADAEGSAERNMELSRRRATVVAQALAARGYPAPTFEVAAAGSAGAATAAGATPLRRRTEVSVKFASAAPKA